METLKVENLTKTYGNEENMIYAVNDVCLTVNKGEFVAITGKSGSGKSTLLHLLGGLDKPDKGKVIINDENLYHLCGDKRTNFRRKNIGFIYQFYNLIPVLTVKENIILPAILDRKKVSDEYFKELVTSLNLDKRLNHLPNELSGGEQQRVSIGRALINHPKIVFADEPTGNLDSKTSRQIMNMLKFYNKIYEQTIVMVTHDEKLALETDRVIVFEDGKVKSDVSTQILNKK